MNSNDLTAKLLAQENLTVIRTNGRTASFDVGTRVLALPLWKDMTPEIESMFILHEVGHALFTTGDDWYKTIESYEPKMRSIIKGYMNVVEDARIEKLVKRRFPGSRKTFFSGYKQLLDRDFFKLKGRNVNEMILIDRINLYFKGGLTLGVKFDAEEKQFIHRIDNIETMEEMIALALELYEFTKTRREADKKAYLEGDIEFTNEDDDDFEMEYDEEDEDDGYGEDESGDNADENDEAEQGGDGDNEDEGLESKTDEALNESLEELADTSTIYQYYEFETKMFKDPIVDFKTIINETAEVDEFIKTSMEEGRHSHNKDFDKFMIESERMVNYLVKEFEMKKSAAAYRRAQVSKSGSLDMSKVFAYKLTDDIFRRITTVPDGKNHGMVFLLDWSGSMDQVISPTIRQVINLAMFCRRINIPFEVYAFSGSYSREEYQNEYYRQRNNFVHELHEVVDRNIMFSDSDFALLNLFSSKMSNLEFKTMARRFTSREVFWTRNYSLGDTPLNDALLYFLDYVPKFKRMHNIDKLSVVTLTDGCGGTLRTNKRMKTMDYGDNGKVKIKNFVTDRVTQKTYAADSYSSSQTTTLLKMIKDRYDVTTLGFYICMNRRSNLYSAYRDNLGAECNETFILEARKQFSEKGFYSMMGTGRDELFIIPEASTRINDDVEVEVSSDMSAATIARKLGKTMNTKKTSRILLDRFIGYVA